MTTTLLTKAVKTAIINTVFGSKNHQDPRRITLLRAMDGHDTVEELVVSMPKLSSYVERARENFPQTQVKSKNLQAIKEVLAFLV